MTVIDVESVYFGNV